MMHGILGTLLVHRSRKPSTIKILCLWVVFLERSAAEFDSRENSCRLIKRFRVEESRSERKKKNDKH
jgi:hypothetical protein